MRNKETINKGDGKAILRSMLKSSEWDEGSELRGILAPKSIQALLWPPVYRALTLRFFPKLVLKRVRDITRQACLERRLERPVYRRDSRMIPPNPPHSDRCSPFRQD